MAENRSHEHEHDVAAGQPPEPHFQVSDVNVWAVGKFAIALILLAIFSLAGVFALFRYFIGSSGGPLPSILAGEQIDARKAPPAPQLEVTEPLDLARMRGAEEKLLTTYGWVDQQKGIVRIPIDRAMDLVAQQGLPYRQQPPAAADTATVPTMAGLGPIMQQPGGPLAGQLSQPPAAANAPEAPPSGNPNQNPGGPSTQKQNGSSTQKSPTQGGPKQ